MVDNLIFVKVLYGGPNHWKKRKAHKPNPVFTEVKKHINNPASTQKDWTKEEIHFVLGEDNKNFLLKTGVPKDQIVLVDKRPMIEPPGACPFYNKTFLVNYAAETFPNNDVLLTDYDCTLIKDFDKEDIYKRLKKNQTTPIQAPVVHYGRKLFNNLKSGRQRDGLMTCFVHWNDKGIINKWFESNKRYPGMIDETALMPVLEEIYGALTVSKLYEFDIDIIRTGHRPEYEYIYCENNYKDAYFYHK